ncbi:AraC family transcriptional regulator [Streptomyces sp. NPDC054861]
MRGSTVLPGTPCEAPREGSPPMHRLEVPMPNTMPFAIGTFDTIGPMSRADFPHRHTFYEIVHVTAGAGAHVVDLTRAELAPPHLGVIAPGQVHHWERLRGLDGTVVLFTEDFLIDHPGDRDLLRRVAARPWATLGEAAHEETARILGELAAEHHRRADGFDSVLRALLHVLVVRAARATDPAAAGAGGDGGSAGGSHPASAGRAGAVAEEFVRLLARAEPALWSVGDCAGHLGVTPGYLTEAVKAATGRTAGQLLRAARTHEAKRLLVRTELSVRQIADRTGFGDPAYFCRFFRRETGLSPGDFRRGADIHHDPRVPSIDRPGAPA